MVAASFQIREFQLKGMLDISALSIDVFSGLCRSQPIHVFQCSPDKISPIG